MCVFLAAYQTDYNKMDGRCKIKINSKQEICTTRFLGSVCLQAAVAVTHVKVRCGDDPNGKVVLAHRVVVSHAANM